MQSNCIPLLHHLSWALMSSSAHTLSQCSSLSLTDQVSNPHKTTGSIIVLYILSHALAHNILYEVEALGVDGFSIFYYISFTKVEGNFRGSSFVHYRIENMKSLSLTIWKKFIQLHIFFFFFFV